MKNLKFLTIAIFTTVLFVSCSNDDDSTPPLINDEEVITTFTATLVPANGGKKGNTITLQWRDLDDTDDTPAEVTVSGDLIDNTTYNGTIVLLDETVSPPDNVTEEVEDESDDHQFFYPIGSGLNLTSAYSNFDNNNNPFGTEFTLTTGAASNGTLTFILRHEPKKPNTGIDDETEGETEVNVTFDLTIQTNK